jgi:RNA polymerase sigma factor (sigma-70 family)
VTQTVFIILARRAGSLSPKTILPGWLFWAVRYSASAALKQQIRRQQREQEAHMQSVTSGNEADPVWERLSPLLDEAIAQLRPQDRNAILLRYFQNKTMNEVALALGVEERAAQKRVYRSLEKLRGFFSRRGVTLESGMIAGTILAHAVQCGHAGLAGTVAGAVVKSSTAAALTSTLLKETIQIMTWTKAKIALSAAAVILLAGGTTTLVLLHGGKAGAVGLHGNWKGQEDGGGTVSIDFSGNHVEFHGADPREWYRATFSLREDRNPKQLIAVITDCPFPQYVGKTENAIYRFENGTLTIAGNEPGNANMPKSFDAPGARHFVFKAQNP